MNFQDMQSMIANVNPAGLDSRQRSLRGTVNSANLDERLRMSAAITLLTSFGPAKKQSKPGVARN